MSLSDGDRPMIAAEATSQPAITHHALRTTNLPSQANMDSPSVPALSPRTSRMHMESETVRWRNRLERSGPADGDVTEVGTCPDLDGLLGPLRSVADVVQGVVHPT